MSSPTEITQDELRQILQVLEKDEEVLAQELDYIKELQDKLFTIKTNSLEHDDERNDGKTCMRCQKSLGVIAKSLSLLVSCSGCQENVCPNCIVSKKPEPQICNYCETLRKIQTVTGVSFFGTPTDVENYLKGGTQIVKTKLFKNEEKPKESSTSNKPKGSPKLNMIKFSGNTKKQVFSKSVDKFIQKPSSFKVDVPISQIAPIKMHSYSKYSLGKKPAFDHGIDPKPTLILETKQNLIISEVKNNPTLSSPVKIEPTLTPYSLSDSAFSDHVENVDRELPVIPEESVTSDTVQYSVVPPDSTMKDFATPKDIQESVGPIDLKIPVSPPQSMSTNDLNEEKIKEGTSTSCISKNVSVSQSLVPPTIILQSSSEPSSVPNSPAEVITSPRISQSSGIRNGVLSGSIKCEPNEDEGIRVRIKIIEAFGLRPLVEENSVSSYILISINQNGKRIFKFKTSVMDDCSAPVWNESFEAVLASLENITIFLLLLKPSKKGIKKLIKMDKKPLQDRCYGSVRIGLANYFSDEERKIMSDLKDNLKNKNEDWLNFQIDLKRTDEGHEHMNEVLTDEVTGDSSPRTLSKRSSVTNDHLKIDDTTSMYSISSQYYNSDNITGQLYLGLKVEEDGANLNVEIIKAEGLSTSKHTSPSTFVKCKLLPKSSTNPSKKTHTIKKTSCPTYSSSFTFKIKSLHLNSLMLSCSVFQQEKVTKDQFCGEVLIPIGLMIQSNLEELKSGCYEYYDLSARTPNSQYGFKGMLHLSIRFEPISNDAKYGNLEARILNVDDLRVSSTKSEPIDSYARCVLLPSSNKKDHKKSQIVTKSDNPHYKLSFSYYNISLEELRNCRCLEVSIWTKSSKFIGGCRLCLSSPETYNEHWQDSSENESGLWGSMLSKHREWITACLPLRYTFISQNIYSHLKAEVSNLWNEYMRQNGEMGLKMEYNSTKNSFEIEIKDLTGILIENMLLLCYLKLRSTGSKSKRVSHYIEPTSQNKWNKSILFTEINSPDSTSVEIRLLVRELTFKPPSEASKSTIKPSINVIGKILLSKGLTRDEWNTPSDEAKSFYSKVVSNPNVCHSALLRLSAHHKAGKLATHKKLNSLSKGTFSRQKTLEKVESSGVIQNRPEGSFSFGESKGKGFTKTLKSIKILPSHKKSKSISQPKSNLISHSFKSTSPTSIPLTQDSPSQPKKQIEEKLDQSPTEDAKVIFSEAAETKPSSMTIPQEIPPKEDEKPPIEPSAPLIVNLVNDQRDVTITTSSYSSCVKEIVKSLEVVPPSPPIKLESTSYEQKGVIEMASNKSALVEDKIETETLVSPLPIETNAPLDEPHSPKEALNDKNESQIIPEITPSEIPVAVFSDKKDTVNSPDGNESSNIPQLEAVKTIPSPKIQTLVNLVQLQPANISMTIFSKEYLPQLSASPDPSQSREESINQTTEIISKVVPRLELLKNQINEIKITHTSYSKSINVQVASPQPTIEATASAGDTKIETVNNKPSPSMDTTMETSTPKTSPSPTVTPVKEPIEMPSLSDSKMINEQFPIRANTVTVKGPLNKLLENSQNKDSQENLLEPRSRSVVHEKMPIVAKPNIITDKTSIDTTSTNISDKINTSDSFSGLKSILKKSGSKKLNKRSSMISNYSTYDAVKVFGDVLVGFRYLNIRNQLTVTIKQANNLIIGDQSKKSVNSYAILKVYPDKTKNLHFKTKTIKESHSPLWNENFVVNINPTDLKLKKLVVSIKHRGTRRKHFMGQTIIPMEDILGDVLKKGYVESWYNLGEKTELEELEPALKPKGTVEVSILLEKDDIPLPKNKSSKKSSISCVLKLKIIEAKNVSTTEPVEKAICKCQLLPDKSKKTKRKSSPIPNDNGCYGFNWDVAYDIKFEKLHDLGIELKIYDSKKKSHVIGSLHLNSGKKQHSWQDSSQEESNLWNFISENPNSSQNFVLLLREPSKDPK